MEVLSVGEIGLRFGKSSLLRFVTEFQIDFLPSELGTPWVDEALRDIKEAFGRTIVGSDATLRSYAGAFVGLCFVRCCGGGLGCPPMLEYSSSGDKELRFLPACGL